MKRIPKPVAIAPNGAQVTYIDNPELHEPAALEVLIEAAPDLMASDAKLTADQETVLFKALHACGYALRRLEDRRRRLPWSREYLHNLRTRLLDFLVNRNIGLIYEMRKRSRVMDVDPDDLTSDGFWTLFRAVESFDPWRGFRFSTYACRSILHGFVFLAQKRRRQNEYLNFARGQAEDAEMRNIRNNEDDIDRQLLIERLKFALADNSAELTPVERFVVERRLLHHPKNRPETLESIGRVFKLSKERVRQIQVSALGKLRDVLDDSAIIGEGTLADGEVADADAAPDDFVYSVVAPVHQSGRR